MLKYTTFVFILAYAAHSETTPQEHRIPALEARAIYRATAYDINDVKLYERGEPVPEAPVYISFNFIKNMPHRGVTGTRLVLEEHHYCTFTDSNGYFSTPEISIQYPEIYAPSSKIQPANFFISVISEYINTGLQDKSWEHSPGLLTRYGEDALVRFLASEPTPIHPEDRRRLEKLREVNMALANRILQRKEEIAKLAAERRALRAETQVTPEQAEKILLMHKEASKQNVPLVFYGRVVDDSNESLADAKVEVGCWRHTVLPSEGHGRAFVDTDANGVFEVNELSGHKLFVRDISKYGYEFTVADRRSFSYSKRRLRLDEVVHSPDRTRPVEFVLRKKNPPTLVLPGKASAQFDKNRPKYYFAAVASLFSKRSFLGRSTARPIEYDDLIVLAEREPNDPNWSVTIRTIDPNDGMILSPNKLYTVPDHGFVKEISISVGIQQDVNLHVYARLRSGRIYLGLDGRISASEERLNLRVDTRTNLNGDQNIDFYREEYRKFLELDYTKRQEIKFGTKDEIREIKERRRAKNSASRSNTMLQPSSRIRGRSR